MAGFQRHYGSVALVPARQQGSTGSRMTVGIATVCDNVSSGLPIPGGLSEQLWSDAQVPVQQCLQHPFVTALAAGTLPR